MKVQKCVGNLKLKNEVSGQVTELKIDLKKLVEGELFPD